jgi:hypothetical protein
MPTSSAIKAAGHRQGSPTSLLKRCSSKPSHHGCMRLQQEPALVHGVLLLNELSFDQTPFTSWTALCCSCPGTRCTAEVNK